MGEVIRIKLEGPDAEPGQIPVADVARLLQGYERAIGRAARPVSVDKPARVVGEAPSRLQHDSSSVGSSGAA